MLCCHQPVHLKTAQELLKAPGRRFRSAAEKKTDPPQTSLQGFILKKPAANQEQRRPVITLTLRRVLV